MELLQSIISFGLPLILVIGGIFFYFKNKNNKTAEVIEFNNKTKTNVLLLEKDKQLLDAKIQEEEELRKQSQNKLEEEKGKNLNDKELSDFFNNRNNKS